MKRIIFLYLVPQSRVCGAVHLCHHTSSWYDATLSAETANVGQECIPGTKLPGQLNFLWWHLIYVGVHYGAWFMSAFWHAEF